MSLLSPQYESFDSIVSETDYSIGPLQFVVLQHNLENKIMDFSSQESNNSLFCLPDGAALTSHARNLLSDVR